MTKQQNECAPSEDADQPGHQPSLIRVFAVRMKKPWVLSYPLSAQLRLWSDWAHAQADLSLAGRTVPLLVLLCCGSNMLSYYPNKILQLIIQSSNNCKILEVNSWILHQKFEVNNHTCDNFKRGIREIFLSFKKCIEYTSQIFYFYFICFY